MRKIIIADTSCLIALTNVDLLPVLQSLYGQIYITEEVNLEFGETLPEWIIVLKVINQTKQSEIAKKLDLGEASSIALALEFNHSILIIDELKGRIIAQSYHIEIIGTLGVLLLASKRGFIPDLNQLLQKLKQNGFRISDDLINKLLSF